MWSFTLKNIARITSIERLICYILIISYSFSYRQQLHAVRDALEKSEERGRRSQLLTEIREEANARLYPQVEVDVRRQLGIKVKGQLKKAVYKKALKLTADIRRKAKGWEKAHQEVVQCAKNLEEKVSVLRNQNLKLQQMYTQATGVPFKQTTVSGSPWDEEQDLQLDEDILAIKQKLLDLDSDCDSD